jgi:hypothetical protein
VSATSSPTLRKSRRQLVAGLNTTSTQWFDALKLLVEKALDEP